MKKDLEQYAGDRLSEQVSYACSGFMDSSDAIRAIEDIESDFDGDSFCPYYHEQVDVINDYERDFGTDAEDICSGREYKAWEWQEAQTAYAYAIAYCGFSSYWETAKRELIEGIEEFISDMQSELETDSERIQLTMTCPHGWASHDRELSDGTMIFESLQLDGCNGMARNVDGVWLSCCIDPKSDTDGAE